MPSTDDFDLVRVITRMNVGGPSHHVTILATQVGGTLNGVVLHGQTDTREGSWEAQARAAGVRLERVPGLRRPFSPINDLRALFWIYLYLRRTKPKIVATHHAKAGTLGRLAATLAGVPIRIHTFHGHVLDGFFGRTASAIFTLVERWMDRLTTHFVAISPRIAEELAQLGIGRGKTSIIPLGLDLEPLRHGVRGRLRPALGLDSSRPLVGIIGRLVPTKAHKLLFESASLLREKHPSLAYVVVGDGELWDELHADVARRSLQNTVHFAGWRTDLADVYADLDLVVCSSLSEGTSVAIIEAGAAGKPVVSTDVGGMADIVHDGVNGLLVPSQDAAALAEAIETVICNPELAASMGAAGRELAFANHSANRLVADLRNLYERLLGLQQVGGAA
jgi:glycosyltransferase involved in cell wall biosynthesis